MRILIQNGVAFYATWVSIASLVNYANYSIWRLGANMQDMGTACLILLLASLINYFVLEDFIWRRCLQYTFSPYFVLIGALIGSLQKNWIYSQPTRNNIISLVILIIACGLFKNNITRIILVLSNNS